MDSQDSEPEKPDFVMMRTLILILSIGMAALVLGCGVFNDGQETSATNTDVTPQVPNTRPAMAEQTPIEMSDPPENVTPQVSEGTGTRSGSLSQAPVAYDGARSLEEKILDSPVIVRVRFDTASSSVEYGNTVYGARYIPTLEFSFSVLEYLKGSGANDIVAVWDAAPDFNTRQEAEAALPEIAAARDTRWDDRNAIVFLKNSVSYLPSTQQADRYYLSWERSYDLPDDGYSIASRYDKLWLPVPSVSTQSGVGTQRFLLDVPSEKGEAPTITLDEMKVRIAAVEAKLSAGDGSEEYRKCVEGTYLYERMKHYRIAKGEEGLYGRIPSQELGSGLASSTLVYEYTEVRGVADNTPRVWLDGVSSSLFGFEYSEPVPRGSTGDGVNDLVEIEARVVTSRPLPAGDYNVNYNNLQHFFVLCDGFKIRYEWTVTATAPDGTLHEAFFDPVTHGNAVAADTTNGILKPASFTDANGATSTIQRIAWEAGSGATGTVKMRLTPHNGITGHAVDFITLDGSVTLSLNVADATVADASDTLTWPVPSQPWHSGDKLMLRIRDAR